MVLPPSCSPRILLREETVFAESLLNAWGGRPGRVAGQREGIKPLCRRPVDLLLGQESGGVEGQREKRRERQDIFKNFMKIFS